MVGSVVCVVKRHKQSRSIDRTVESKTKKQRKIYRGIANNRIEQETTTHTPLPTIESAVSKIGCLVTLSHYKLIDERRIRLITEDEMTHYYRNKHYKTSTLADRILPIRYRKKGNYNG